jgi:hypothetical protein
VASKIVRRPACKRNKARLPPLTVAQILAWADAHRARTGEWPRVLSGPIPEAPGESWRAVNLPTQANLTLDRNTTSAVGGQAQGVLGCFNLGNSEITLIQGWNWYAGSDPTAIGSDQYSFETTVTHELGHALGLGGSADPKSPMYESLPTGLAKGGLAVADLALPPLDTTYADALHAAGFGSDDDSLPATALAPAGNAPLPARFVDRPGQRGRCPGLSRRAHPHGRAKASPPLLAHATAA